MNPILLKKTDGHQLLVDLERVVAIEELANDTVRVNVVAGNGMLTFVVTETMAAVIAAISGGGE